MIELKIYTSMDFRTDKMGENFAKNECESFETLHHCLASEL